MKKLNMLKNTPLQSTATFGHGESSFTYNIIKSPKIKSRLTLKIHPDMSITAHAPLHMADKKIHHFVLHKADWISSKITMLKQQKIALPDLSDTSYYFLGKRYELELNNDVIQYQPVKLSEDKIQVATISTNREDIETLLTCWYKSNAESHFRSRLIHITPLIPWLKKVPAFRLRSMKSRWGSCSDKQEITLNYHLIKAPLACIDYVIIHELCHFIEMNHSANFYALLTSVLPDWKQHKAKLHELGRIILP